MDSGLADQHPIRREASEPFGDCKVDAEVAEVTVVDADERRAERERPRHLRLVMHLDERVHAEAARLGDDLARVLVVEQREHHENRIGAGNPRLRDLPRVNKEVLGEDRSIELGTGGGEIVERPAEIGAIAKHAQRIGNPGIAARQGCRIGTRANLASRRRCLLDLQNEASTLLRQHRREAARRRLSPGAERIQRNPVEAPRQLVALGGGDLAKHSDRFNHG